MISPFENIALADESFDCYISNLCLNLQAEPIQLINEAYRLLKPDSKAGFTIYGRLENCRIFTIMD